MRNYHLLSPPPLGSRSPAFCGPGAASRRALRPPLLGARGTPRSARGPGLCGAPAPGSPARPPRSAKARGARRTEGGSESPVSPRAHAPRAPQANTRLSWNYSREGRDGLRPQLPTRDGLGGVLPRPQSCDQLEPVPAGPPGRGYSGRSGRRAAEGTWARERNPAGPGQTSWTEQHPLAGPRVLSPRSGRGCPCARRRPASTPGRGDLGVRAPRQKGRRGRGAAGSLGGKCGAPGPRDGGRDPSVQRRPQWSSPSARRRCSDSCALLARAEAAPPRPSARRQPRGRRFRPGLFATPSPAPGLRSEGRRGGWGDE